MGFRGRVRPRGLVHGARAYLAGAGTTGSLLAVAALVFIVASALVAFRGWPHVAAATSPGRVVISANRGASAGTPAARRLAFVAGAGGGGVAGAGGAARGAGGAGGAGRGTSAAGRGLGAPRPPRHTIGAPASTSVPVSGGSGGSGGSTCASGCGTAPAPSSSPTPVQKVQQTLSQATNSLGNVVSGTGSQLGSTVRQTTSGVAGALGGSSTPVGGTVSKVGSGAAQTVTGVTQALGGVLKGLGH